MPASYLKRHRPICTVLQLIKEAALSKNDTEIAALADEAIDYAQRMSKRLMEYKNKNTGSHRGDCSS